MITELARPKVNLSLKVVGRRSDGYHLLDSLVVFPEGGDRLSFKIADDLTLSVSGEGAEDLEGTEDNLVYRVARYLKEEFGVQNGARIHLEKNLPVASGIGGGSSDAAATLRGLNKLWGLGLSSQKLEEIGLQFGADIPVCIESQARYMRGVGEKLSDPAKLPDFHILLINPRKSISTPEIFRALNYPKGTRENPPPELSDNLSAQEMAKALKTLTNDLQAPAESLIPEITVILHFLLVEDACLFHRMSGSGATCFGLFENATEGQQALQRLKAEHPHWWAELMPVTSEG